MEKKRKRADSQRAHRKAPNDPVKELEWEHDHIKHPDAEDIPVTYASSIGSDESDTSGSSSNDSDDDSDAEVDEHEQRMDEWREKNDKTVAEGNTNDEEVQADFDFFNLSDADFMTIKYLVRNLLDVDNIRFNLSHITDLIIKHGIGSTIKVDGEDSDAMAFLTVLDLAELRKDPEIAKLCSYLVSQTETSDPALSRTLRKLFSSKSTEKAGLILCSRVLNLPIELVPHLYAVLVEDLKASNKKFDTFITLSRAFSFDNAAGSSNGELDMEYYHQEDAALQPLADRFGFFDYAEAGRNAASRSAFTESGIIPKGHIIVTKATKLPTVVETLRSWCESMQEQYLQAQMEKTSLA